MVAPLFMLLVLAVFMAVIAAVVYGVVSLLAHRNVIALVAGILAVPLVAAMVLFLFVFSARVETRQSQLEHTQAVEIREQKAIARQYAVRAAERPPAPAQSQPLPQPVEQAVAEETPVPVATSKTEPEAATPAAGKKSNSMLRMLASALMKAIDEQDAKDATATAAKPAAPAEAAPSRPEPLPKRPAWIDAAPGVQDGAYQVAIAIGPYTTRLECDAKRFDELQRAIDKYVVASYGRKAAGRIQLPADFIDQHLVKAEWEERRAFDLSPTLRVPMVQLHVLLRFDRPVANRIHDIWTQADVLRRVEFLAAAGALVILVLALAWAYLKLDLSTAGRYRWRLRLVASVLLLAIVAISLRILA